MEVMEKIGRYSVSERIGAGSFATVWKGHDDDLDVPVAIKVLADNWTGNDDVRQRFLTEARLMRRIRDDAVVRVYDIGTTPGGQPYFVMDYADAGSLEERRKNLLPPQEALLMCAQACRALDVIHRHGVIHRDVTPGNILLSHDSRGHMRALIADLGVAKSTVGMAGATMTAGTPAYMAIEQATGVGVLDHRADIYSMGAVTYAMLTGRPPFRIKNLQDLLAHDPHQPPAPVAQRVQAPSTLDTLLASALSADPERRPPSAEVMAQALERIAKATAGGSGLQLPPEMAVDATVLRPPSAGSPQSLAPDSLAPDSTAPQPQSLSPQSLAPQSLPPQSLAPQSFGQPPQGQPSAYQSQISYSPTFTPHHQSSPNPVAPSSQSSPQPYAGSQLSPPPTSSTQPGQPRRAAGPEPEGRSPLQIVLLVVSGFALFGVTLLVTILIAQALG